MRAARSRRGLEPLTYVRVENRDGADLTRPQRSKVSAVPSSEFLRNLATQSRHCGMASPLRLIESPRPALASVTYNCEGQNTGPATSARAVRQVPLDQAAHTFRRDQVSAPHRERGEGDWKTIIAARSSRSGTYAPDRKAAARQSRQARVRSIVRPWSGTS